jgi:hypothetical protein
VVNSTKRQRQYHYVSAAELARFKQAPRCITCGIVQQLLPPGFVCGLCARCPHKFARLTFMLDVAIEGEERE